MTREAAALLQLLLLAPGLSAFVTARSAENSVTSEALLYSRFIVFCPGLTPNTTYRVSIRAKNIKASPYVDEKSLIRLLEKLSAHTEFRTLTKGEKRFSFLL